MSLTEKDKLKFAILKAKSTEGLPYQLVTAFCRAYPKFNTDQGRRNVSDVLQLRYTDKEITKKFVSFVDDIREHGYK